MTEPPSESPRDAGPESGREAGREPGRAPGRQLIVHPAFRKAEGGRAQAEHARRVRQMALQAYQRRVAATDWLKQRRRAADAARPAGAEARADAASGPAPDAAIDVDWSATQHASGKAPPRRTVIVIRPRLLLRGLRAALADGRPLFAPGMPFGAGLSLAAILAASFTAAIGAHWLVSALLAAVPVALVLLGIVRVVEEGARMPD